MAVLDIVQIGQPVLRQVAQRLSDDEIKSEKVQRFIDDLIETMRAANGAGLAATQVGQTSRICVVEVKAGNPRYPYKPAIPLRVMINPEIEPLGTATFLNYEGCLSVPNLRGMVPRYESIRLRYLDRQGVAHEEDITGISAGTYQHEVDHLDGKVFLDRVEDTATLCTWDNFEAFHKADFVKAIMAMEKRLGNH